MRNTDFAVGLVIYAGAESKIMMNAKKPPTKVSNVLRMMNQMLYSVHHQQFNPLGVHVPALTDYALCDPLRDLDWEQCLRAQLPRDKL